jgi:hypothetical protein
MTQRGSIRTVFLSHAGGEDDSWTRWIDRELRDLGLDVIVDYEQWASGQVAGRIHEALSTADAVVCLFSPTYFEPGRWTLDELNAAWGLYKKGAIYLIAFEVGAVEYEGLYDSLLTKKLFQLTEIAARRAIKDHLRRVASTPNEPTGDATSNRPPPYPGPHARPGGGAVQHISPEVEDLINAAEDLARDVIETRDISEFDMARLMSNTQTLARSYNYEPPAVILKSAFPRYESTRLALESTRDPNHIAEINYVMGRLHAILSYATLDLGRDDAATTHALAVIRCAQLAGHTELEAWGWGTSSMILRFQGRNEQSVTHALRGMATKVKGASMARLHAQAALSYVELQNVSGSTEQLKQCDDIVDVPPSSPEMHDGIFLFSRAKHHYYAGSAYADFGPAFSDRAVEESTAAIETFRSGDLDTRSYSDELLAHVHLARGLFMSDRFDEIPLALDALFTSDPNYRTSWHLQWLDRLVVALKQGKSRGSTIEAEIEASVTDFKDQAAGDTT